MTRTTISPKRASQARHTHQTEGLHVQSTCRTRTHAPYPLFTPKLCLFTPKSPPLGIRVGGRCAASKPPRAARTQRSHATNTEIPRVLRRDRPATAAHSRDNVVAGSAPALICGSEAAISGLRTHAGRASTGREREKSEPGRQQLSKAANLLVNSSGSEEPSRHRAKSVLHDSKPRHACCARRVGSDVDEFSDARRDPAGYSSCRIIAHTQALAGFTRSCRSGVELTRGMRLEACGTTNEHSASQYARNACFVTVLRNHDVISHRPYPAGTRTSPPAAQDIPGTQLKPARTLTNSSHFGK